MNIQRVTSLSVLLFVLLCFICIGCDPVTNNRQQQVNHGSDNTIQVNRTTSQTVTTPKTRVKTTTTTRTLSRTTTLRPTQNSATSSRVTTTPKITSSTSGRTTSTTTTRRTTTTSTQNRQQNGDTSDSMVFPDQIEQNLISNNNSSVQFNSTGLGNRVMISAPDMMECPPGHRKRAGICRPTIGK